jgi:hypothetical protein
MIKTTLKIDGMMCGMCESHMNDVIFYLYGNFLFRKDTDDNGIQDNLYAQFCSFCQKFFPDVESAHLPHGMGRRLSSAKSRLIFRGQRKQSMKSVMR